jgi:hypothetical protein
LVRRQTNQIPFQLRKEREQGDDYLGVHIPLVDVEVLFDRDEPDISLDQRVDQGDHFRGATPQPAKLGDDQGVGFIKDLHQLVDSALLAGLLRDEIVISTNSSILQPCFLANSKSSNFWWIRSDQVQKCLGKLPDGIFGGLGLQPPIPFFIPFIHYLGRARATAAPPLVARLKPLNRSVPLRPTSLAAFNAATQPIRPALRADESS